MVDRRHRPGCTSCCGLSVWKDELTKQMHTISSDACLRRLAELVPCGCRVTILADRGFGDQKLFAFLADLGNTANVIRFRGNIHVTDTDAEPPSPLTEWRGIKGVCGPFMLLDARVHRERRRKWARSCACMPKTMISQP